MKYNLSTIMTKAHEFRKAGLNKSDSLKNAWAIEKIETQRFLLSMKDRWNRNDYAEDKQMADELFKLNSVLNTVVATPATKEVAPVVTRVALTNAERSEAYDEINRLTDIAWDYNEGEIKAEYQDQINALWDAVHNGRIVTDVAGVAA